MTALAQNTLFTQFVVILGMIILDVIGAVSLGLKTNNFEWKKLLDFLKSQVAASVLVWAFLAAIGWGADRLGVVDGTLIGLTVMVDAVYAFIVARLSASIWDKLTKLGLIGAVVGGTTTAGASVFHVASDVVDKLFTKTPADPVPVPDPVEDIPT